MAVLKGNSAVLRASVSVLAVMWLTSGALAQEAGAADGDAGDGVSTDIGVDQSGGGDDGWATIDPIDPSVVVDPGVDGVDPAVDIGPVEPGDDNSATDDLPDVTIDPVADGEVIRDVPVEINDLPIDDSGIMYMTGGGAEAPQSSPVVSHKPVLGSDDSHDAGRVPNLCDTAGAGWNWLCGKRAE